LPGAPPNQGWTALLRYWFNPLDYGAVCDGVADDTAGFDAALTAAHDETGPSWEMPTTDSGYCRVSHTVDLSGMYIIYGQGDTIIYTGTDAGPAIQYKGEANIGWIYVQRGTDTANQVMVSIPEFGAAFEGLGIYNCSGCTSGFIALDVNENGGPIFTATVIKQIYTEAPVRIGGGPSSAAPMQVQILSGAVNVRSSSTDTSGPFILTGGAYQQIALSNVTAWSRDGNDTSACFVKFVDPGFGEPMTNLTLSNVRFDVDTPATPYTGAAICAPSSPTGVYPTVNGNFGSDYVTGFAGFDAAHIITGRVTGKVTYSPDTTSPTFSPSYSFTNSIISSGFAYSAAGTPLPTCDTAGIGVPSYVSDATSPTYNGTYTSGGSVKVPVVCNGSAWTTH
jgi:hypothetical protein